MFTQENYLVYFWDLFLENRFATRMALPMIFFEPKNFRLVVIATHRDDDPADEEEEGDEELPEDDLQKKDKKKKPDVS